MRWRGRGSGTRAGRTWSASVSSTRGTRCSSSPRNRALLYLRQYYGERVKEIFGLTFDYSKGYVDPVATVWKNLVRLPAGPSPQSGAVRAGVPAVRAGPGGHRFRALQRLVGVAQPRALYQH